MVNLIDAVAKGGNFMPAIGPDADGQFDPEAVREFQQAGDWLKINGEAIYATRPREGPLWREGDDIRFTRSKDHTIIYAIGLKWPGRTLKLATVRPQDGSTIRMLGAAEPLKWSFTENEGLAIELPAAMQDEKNRPCRDAWAWRIVGKTALRAAAPRPGGQDHEGTTPVSQGHSGRIASGARCAGTGPVLLRAFVSYPLETLIVVGILAVSGLGIVLYVWELVVIGWAMDFLLSIGMPKIRAVSVLWSTSKLARSSSSNCASTSPAFWSVSRSRAITALDRRAVL